MSHLERKQREKEELRLKIFDAALSIAKAEGWSNVTIRKIADKIEYTPPIIYEHFNSKEDLFKEIVYNGFEQINNTFLEARKKEKDAKKLIKTISIGQFDFAFKNRELFSLMFSTERPAPNQNMIKIFGMIRELFFNLAKGDAKLYEEIFLTWKYFTHGAIAVMLQYPPPPQFSHVNLREIYESMIDRYLNTI